MTMVAAAAPDHERRMLLDVHGQAGVEHADKQPMVDRCRGRRMDEQSE